MGDASGWLEDACCASWRFGLAASNDVVENGEVGGGEHGAMGCGL